MMQDVAIDPNHVPANVKTTPVLRVWERSALLLAAVLAAAVGVALVFFPMDFEASAGIALPQDASLLSEMRAPGGALVLLAMLILRGALDRRFALPAAQLGSALYLGYALARGVGFWVDGAPHPSLIQATGVEMVAGLICLGLWVKLQTGGMREGITCRLPHRGQE